MPAGSILSLPVEALSMICATMCRHCSAGEEWPSTDLFEPPASDLAKLSVTCRILRDIAQPYLYHDVHTSFTLPLLRTVIARPELGALVRGLAIQPSIMYEPTSEDFQLLDNASRSLGLSPPSKGWQELPLEKLDNYHWDYLLAFLPSLEALSVVTNPSWPIGECLRGKVVLESVRRILMDDQCEYGGFDLDFAENLIASAPNVESLRLIRCREVLSGDLPLANVTSIRFFSSRLSPESLENIIRACPALERFAYWSAVDIFDNDNREATWSEAQNALRLRKDSIKHIEFDVGDDFVGWRETGEELGDFFGTFADFSRLEVLSTRPEGFGHKNVANIPELLPHSLTTLGLAGFKGVRETIIAVAHSVQAGGFPKLREIMADCKDGLELVQPILADNGIEIGPYDDRVTEPWN